MSCRSPELRESHWRKIQPLAEGPRGRQTLTTLDSGRNSTRSLLNELNEFIKALH